MNVPTIEMEPRAAAEKQAEYEKVLTKSYPDTTAGRRQKQLDEAAAMGFAALAAGKRVLNVHTALSYAGLFPDGQHAGLPRLAIARADASSVSYTFSNPKASFQSIFNSGYYREQNTKQFSDLIWDFSLAQRAVNRKWRHTAIVPTIPPGVRPHYARLAKLWILWEADWQRAPVDPFLLRHLSGDMYTIEAEWDLTELERGLLDAAALRN